MDNIEEMSVEELRQMLIAKDAMVVELEQKIQEMTLESEASMNKEEDDKEETEAMAEDSDKEEEKKELKAEKLSEKLTDSILLNEVQALREKVAKIEAEKAEIEKTNAVNTLLNEGKIAPSETNVAGKAYELKDLQAEFWQMFNERQANSAVPLVEVGHGASGEEINKKSLDEKIREMSREKSITYSEALNYFQKNETDYYIKAMEK